MLLKGGTQGWFSVPVVDPSCLHGSGLEEQWRIILCGPNVHQLSVQHFLFVA